MAIGTAHGCSTVQGIDRHDIMMIMMDDDDDDVCVCVCACASVYGGGGWREDRGVSEQRRGVERKRAGLD